MKSITFDAGPVISFATNNLLGLLEQLKGKFKGDFYITKGVENELVKKPLESKKFKFEALQILEQIKKGSLKVVDNDAIHNKGIELLNLANQSFSAYGHYINIVSFAEMESLAAALYFKSEAIVIDERTTRELVENPMIVKKVLEKKIHTRISVNKDNLKEFQKQAKEIKVIRSTELVTIAYELGLLNQYLVEKTNPRKTLLEGLLWGVKLNGCAVSDIEINRILRSEGLH